MAFDKTSETCTTVTIPSWKMNTFFATIDNFNDDKPGIDLGLAKSDGH